MMVRNELTGANAQFVRIIRNEVMVRLTDGDYAYWPYDRCITINSNYKWHR
jgi:hypothetical protein